ncbi:MAG: hypothetical protein PHI48_08650 [Bacteroidales bacterium]|nr:hypothetical protein [Bacteroidales bacterium]
MNEISFKDRVSYVVIVEKIAKQRAFFEGCEATSAAAAAESCDCFRQRSLSEAKMEAATLRLLIPPCRFSPDQQIAVAGRPWQPLFERSEFVGCHSKAFVGCPGRNAAGEFFLCELIFFAEKKKVGERESRTKKV